MSYTSNKIKIDSSFVNDYKFYDKKIIKEVGIVAPTLLERCIISTVYGAFFESLQSDCYLDVSDLSINKNLKILDMGKYKYDLSNIYPCYGAVDRDRDCSDPFDVIIANGFCADNSARLFDLVRGACKYFLGVYKKEGSYYAVSLKGELEEII